jgi:hypothetical protein
MNRYFLIYSSVVEHLGCSQSLAIVNNASINMSVQVALSYPAMHSFWYMPKSSITGSYDSSNVSFLRGLHIAFHSRWTNLHSHQHCGSVPFPQCPCQRLLFVLLMIAILTGWGSFNLHAFPLWPRMLSIPSFCPFCHICPWTMFIVHLYFLFFWELSA